MISTKNLPQEKENTGNSTKPILSPGNHKVTILGVEIKPERDREKFGDALVLKVLGEAIPNFKGIEKLKGNPDKGHYDGQVGYVNYSKWAFKDHVTNDGTEYSRDAGILYAIRSICTELKLSWFEDADNKYNTVDALVAGFNTEAPFKNIYFHACINGREYESKGTDKTYINHQLFLPRADRVLGKPFSLDASKVIKFFESSGIERLKPKDPTSLPTNSEKKTPETTIVKEGVFNSTTVKDQSTLQSNADFLADLNKDNPEVESKTDIITSDTQDKLPWE